MTQFDDTVWTGKVWTGIGNEESLISIIRLDSPIDWYDEELDTDGDIICASQQLEEKFIEAGWDGNAPSVKLIKLTQDAADYATPNRKTGWFAKNNVNGTSFLGLEVNQPLSNSVSDNPYDMPAKEVTYNGVTFRSKNEARLAVAFDAWHWKWDYEPERFTVFGSNETYLPDFFLPDFDLYVEAKGNDKQLFAAQERITAAIDFNSTPISKGLLLMGPLPFEQGRRSGFRIKGSFLQWNEGVNLRNYYIRSDYMGAVRIDFGEWVSSSGWPYLPPKSSVNMKIINDSGGGFQSLYLGLLLARSARFDFDDSVERVIAEGRKVVGGFVKSQTTQNSMASPQVSNPQFIDKNNSNWDDRKPW